MSKEKTQSKKFQVYMKIWNPKNWVIKSQTVNGKKVYSYDDYQSLEITTRYPGWRCGVFFTRTLSWFKNGFFFLIFVMLLHGPLSIRALLSPWEYYPGKTVNTRTGELEDDKNSKVESFCSRISLIWRNIRKSRADFENKPDDGILGKSVTRIFNVVWNYIGKGLVGTSLLVVGFPLLVAINVSFAVVALIYSPLWCPLLSLLEWFFNVLLYDSYCTDWKNFKHFPLLGYVLGDLGIFGVAQVVLSFVCATALHPFLSVIIGAFGSVRFITRAVYDFLIYFLLLKRVGRIPAKDSFLTKRTAGPGLGGQWYYQVETDVALIALQVHLEREELERYKSFIRNRVAESTRKLQNLEDEIFVKFGLTYDKSKGLYASVNKRNEEILEDLRKLVNDHLDSLSVQVSNIPSNIKQTAAELSQTIQKGALIIEEFYPGHIFSLMDKDEISEFWGSLNLLPGDWVGLTKYHLERVFPGRDNNSILYPLEDDQNFYLKVKHLDTMNFLEMIAEGEPRDNLEKLIPIHVFNPKYTSKINEIAVQPKAIYCFTSLSQAWKKALKKEEE